MTGPLTITASILLFGYSAMLVVIGLAGLVGGRWELAAVFGLDPASWPPAVAATMLNQYRFLKSVELGAGIFCFAYRPDIMAGGRASRVFLAIVGLGVCARSIAWIVDGRPSSLFLLFLALEALVFVVVALHVRLQDVPR